LLRRTAEQSMIAMARKLFSRLAQLPTSDDEAWSSDPNDPTAEPEHATLAAEPVGTDGQDDERRLRRMTMPDPKSSEVPAAAAAALQELKAIGEAEEQEEQEGEAAAADASGTEGVVAPEPAEPDASSEQDAKLSEKPHSDSTAQPSQPSAVSAHESSVFERQQQTAAALAVEPYGLPAIKEILRVVVSLLDPQTTQHTEAMRLLGLAMLSSILELASHSIARFPSLRAIIQDSACKHLFQLARSEHSRILALALRAIAILFETMREHLKLQYELFLTFMLDRLAPNFPIALEPWNDETQGAVAAKRAKLSDGPSRTGTPEPAAKGAPPPPPPPPPPHPKTSDRAPATGETREVMLETLSLLLRTYEGQRPGSSDALVQLYVNFDCDVDCENMFERFIHFLCRSVYASNPQFPLQQDSTQVLALDALLNFVGMMTARQEGLNGASDIEDATIDNADGLAAQKGQKAAILAGAARFNAKPKDGLAFLEAQGFIDASGKNGETRAQSIAKFLKDCPRLDKKLLGDYISRPDNLEVLVAFINLFDFRDKSIAEALRELLETFRLPGESQQISRITETFASAYFAVGPAEIRNEDAVYVLAYSVIMLNTDLHNPQNKRRMSVEDYRRNLRGVNDGKDFDPEYLGAIYDVIRKREIVMPEEHVGQLGFDYAWKELLRRSRKAGPLLLPHTAVFDRAVFESCWRPVVASIAHAFSSYRDEHLLERAIGGFRQCAILASRFGMYELFDYMIQGLAGATGLLDDRVPGGGALTNNAVVDVDGQSITVSPLSVRFGANFKGQLAAVVLFTITNGNGNAIRAGWAPIFEIFKNLFVSSLLPAPLSHMHDFAKDGSEAATPDGLIPIPLKPRKAPGPPPQDPRAQGGGLFSTLSSYLLSPYSAANEPAAPEVIAEDVESSLCTVDCITSCRLDELYAQVLELNEEALLPALRALKALADRCSVERVTAPVHEQHRLVQDREASSSGRSTPTNPGSSLAGARSPLHYDPTAIFAMELLTSVACSSTAVSTAEAWNVASEHLIDVLKMPRLMHPMHIERAVASLLRLAEKISPSAEGALRDQIFVALDLLRSIPAELRSSISPQLVAGLTQIIRTDPGFARSQTEWGLVLALIADHSVTRNARAAALASDAVRQIAQQRLTSDNFAGVVSLLRSFAAGADCSGWRAEEQRQGQRRTLTEKKELADYETQCQQRGVEAIVALEGMKGSIPRLVDASGLAAADGESWRRCASSQSADALAAAWTQFWLPLMTALSEQCANRHRPAREAAITHLQRTLLASEILSGTAASLPQRSTLVYIFTAVVFSTLDELLKPEVFKADAEGILEARIRMCALLSKVYLHYLPQLASPADEPFQRLWMQVLDNLERCESRRVLLCAPDR
jgi:brefeldin A-resistance guanine nucleotide exchange factor 1